MLDLESVSRAGFETGFASFSFSLNTKGNSISLMLSFLIYKMGMIIPILGDSLENETE